VLDARLEVVHQPVVGAVDNLVDGEGRGRRVGVGGVVLRELRLDPDQPLIELVLWAGVERREGADDARLALRDDEVRRGDDEERRADAGQAQFSGQLGRGRHQGRVG